MSKLTLSVDAEIAARAKRYAKRHGTSVSEMVENYLDVISHPPTQEALPPILRSMRGVLKKADVRDYRRYLAKKYR